jgi:hypothetical protein
MAGQVKHASIFDLRHLDATAVKILATLPDKKTDTILGAVADVFAKEGIRLMSSVAYLAEAPGAGRGDHPDVPPLKRAESATSPSVFKPPRPSPGWTSGKPCA